MGRRTIMLGALISLITGCSKTPVEPKGPGVSAPLSFPVLLTGERNLVVKDDEMSLTTTTVASGLNFLELTLVDSGGAKYSIRKVADFGKRSVFSDMGTGQFRIFLDMKPEGKISLANAKALAMSAALGPNGVVGDSPRGIEIATKTIQGAQSMGELIELCRKSWEWR